MPMPDYIVEYENLNYAIIEHDLPLHDNIYPSKLLNEVSLFENDLQLALAFADI